MGWVENLSGKIVCVDTSPLIFFIERHIQYIDLLRPFFQAVHRGDIKLITSSVTLLEVLVHPIRHKDESLAAKYNDILLSSPNISTLPITPRLAQIAAEVRAEYHLKTPDAIQLATALTHRADAFLTNDRDFPSLSEIQILNLKDLIVE